nr:MAG TPA: Integrase [Caudoviricetes sp.]
MEYVRKTFTFEGKRYAVRGKTEKEAIINMANKIRDLEEGNIVISGNTLVKDWALKCVETYKTTQAEETRKTYLGKMKSIIFRQIGDRPLKSIKPFDVQNVMNSLQGYSKSYISDIYQMLKFIFSKAKINKLIPEDPTLDLQKPKGTKKKRRAITANEEYHFLKVCETNDRFLVFLLMYYCGCRTSEAINVMGKDIIVLAEDGKAYNALHIRGTKTGNADRNVPLPDALYERIKDAPKFDYVAKDTKGNKLTKSSLKCALNALRREMNISMGCTVFRNQLIPPYPLADDFVPYCLRHTYCSNLCKKCVDIRVAQYLMGHSDIRLTANIYTHTDISAIIDVAEKMSM